MTVELREWSWSALVKALDNDEERALRVLERMPGLGTYEDEVHPQPTRGRMPFAVKEPEPPQPRMTCKLGHPLVVRNGWHPSGAPKMLCRECSSVRRKRAYTTAARRAHLMREKAARMVDDTLRSKP